MTLRLACLDRLSEQIKLWCDEDPLDRLLEHLCLAVAKNPIAPSSVLGCLASYANAAVLSAIFRHPNVTAEQLVGWAEDSRIHPVLRLVCVCHPNYPEASRRADAEALVALMETMSAAGPEPLGDVSDADFVLALSELNLYPEDADKKTVAKAAKSKDWLERAAATFSPSIQPSLLRMLLDDEVEVVKQLAMRRLKGLDAQASKRASA
jgi:hypothetical protein